MTEVSEGRFREDLFYRLNVLPIRMPALRERPSDIPLLVEHFLERFNDAMGTSITGFSANATKLMQSYPWPGNVRELENTVERAVVLSDGPEISADDLPERIRNAQDRIRAVLNAEELSIKKLPGSSRKN